MGTGDGELRAASIDQDCFTADGVLDVPLEVRSADDGGAADARLARLVAARAVPLLRARLAAFIAELKARE